MEEGEKSLKHRIMESLTDPRQYAVLEGEFRRGLKDLQDVVLHAFPDSMGSRDEPGTIANPTSFMVTEEIKGPFKEKMSLEELRSIAAERKAEPTMDRQQDY